MPVCKQYFLIIQSCTLWTAMFMWKEKEKNLFQPHIRLRCYILSASKQKQPSSTNTYWTNALFKRVILAKFLGFFHLENSNISTSKLLCIFFSHLWLSVTMRISSVVKYWIILSFEGHNCQLLVYRTGLLLLLLSRFGRVWLCATPQTAAHQAPLSLGFSRQEHWSGLPFPSPMQESEKSKWSRSVVSDS